MIMLGLDFVSLLDKHINKKYIFNLGSSLIGEMLR